MEKGKYLSNTKMAGMIKDNYWERERMIIFKNKIKKSNSGPCKLTHYNKLEFFQHIYIHGH